MRHDYYNPAIDAARSYHGSLLSSTRNAYFTRHLLQKAMSVIKFTLPEHWDENYFLYTLFVNGFVCILDSEKPAGVIPQHGTISGYNLYYNPSSVTVSNPNIPLYKEVELGKTGEIIQLTPDYTGILDCVNEYSEMLANASAAINLNLFNSRTSFIFWAKNEAQAQTYKKMYDEVGAGKPAVVLDKSMALEGVDGKPYGPFDPFNAKLKENYVASQIIDDMQKIEQSFARKIGLPEANTLKRERMSVDETNKGDIDTRSNVALWLDMVNLGIERVQKLYPETNISARLRFEKELSQDARDSTPSLLVSDLQTTS